MKNSVTTRQGGLVKLDVETLTKLVREVQSYPSAHVKVGVLGPKAQRADAGSFHNPWGLNNAEIGLKNEFGSLTERVPERSFLRMPMLEKLPKKLEKVARKDWIIALINEGKLKLLANLGLAGESVVFDAFATKGFGKWKPNTPYTVMLKRSARPLIDHGELRQSISSEVVKS